MSPKSTLAPPQAPVQDVERKAAVTADLLHCVDACRAPPNGGGGGASLAYAHSLLRGGAGGRSESDADATAATASATAAATAAATATRPLPPRERAGALRQSP